MRNKRALVAILAVVLAILGIASLVVWTNDARDRAFSGTETIAVWQVTKNVPAGAEADLLRQRAGVCIKDRRQVGLRAWDRTGVFEAREANG